MEIGTEVMNPYTGELGIFYQDEYGLFEYKVRLKSGGFEKYDTMSELKEYWEEIE